MNFPPTADYLASKATIRAFFQATRSTMAKKGCQIDLTASDMMDTPISKDFVEM